MQQITVQQNQLYRFTIKETGAQFELLVVDNKGTIKINSGFVPLKISADETDLFGNVATLEIDPEIE